MKLVMQTNRPTVPYILCYPAMGSIALGAAFAAVQLVHQAYSKVKTSKARCARLVERCQFIVERLERISMTKRGGDAVIIRERIRELERWVVLAPCSGRWRLIVIMSGLLGIPHKPYYKWANRVLSHPCCDQRATRCRSKHVTRL
jgi:hypothetical protein